MKIDKAVEKYKNHPSIKKIKECFTYSESFNFTQVSVKEVSCQLEKLNPGKSSPVGSIPAKVIKENSDIFAPVVQNHFNANISQNVFPEVLKAGDIIPLYKKDANFIKKNYRPITVLPATSKVYEKLMESQMKAYARCFLNALLCGFRENYSTQHALLRFLENCRKALDIGNTAGAVFTDLSKAFDCLNHDLIIAELEAYGFGKGALQLIHSYLDRRKQRVKVNGQVINHKWKNIPDIVLSTNIPIKQQLMPTEAYEKYKLREQVPTTTCRSCHNAEETVKHLMSSCSAIAQSLSKARHDKMLRPIYHFLLSKYKFNQSDYGKP